MGPFLAQPVPDDNPQGPEARSSLTAQDVTHWPRRSWATGTPWSFFFFKHLYWSIIALQWCVSFCYITK